VQPVCDRSVCLYNLQQEGYLQLVVPIHLPYRAVFPKYRAIDLAKSLILLYVEGRITGLLISRPALGRKDLASRVCETVCQPR
jgi:hypothetical protein